LRRLRQISAFAVALLLLAPTVPAFADDGEAMVNEAIKNVVGSDPAQAETVIRAFQQAVIAGNRADVAAFIRYPITARINGHKITVKSAAAFIKRYDAIMQPEIIHVVQRQKYGDLFVNYQGVMFGYGEVWLHGVCIDRQCKQSVFKVITLQTTGRDDYPADKPS
jgi:hypothetical protein